MGFGLHLSAIRIGVWALCLGALPVASQAFSPWVWQDDKGQKVYSDVPPPLNVPADRILVRPGVPQVRIQSVPAEASGPGEATAAGATAAPAAKSGDDATRRKEESERAAIERKNAEIRADNCKRARASVAMLQSEGPLATVNDKGERVTMDDAMRRAELARAQAIVRDNCR